MVPRRPVPRASLLRAALLVLFFVYAASFSLGSGSAVNDALYHVVLVSGAAACLARAVSVSLDRAAWSLIAAGLLAWSAADIYWTLELQHRAEVPYPSISDAGWLVFYPACFAGVALMLRRQARVDDRTLWLDGLMAALGAGSLVAALVLPSIVDASLEGTASAVAVNLGYVVGDLLLLGLLVLTCGLFAWRPPRTWVLIGLGVALSGVADITYLYALAQGAEAGPPWAAWLWPAAVVATACAALESPTLRTPAAEAREPRLTVPSVMAIAAFVVLIWDHFAPVSHTAALLAGLTIAVVFVRTVLTFRENRVLLGLSREEARVDELTGLGNRRALSLDLDAAMRSCSPEDPSLLLLFDLNGFKAYNDLYGHPSGDALLARLGRALSDAVDGRATAYRMGGDEFCVLGWVTDDDRGGALAASCLAALSDRGDGFEISAANGALLLDDPTLGVSAALREADRRMYADKDSARLSASGQSVEVLVRVLAERNGDLAEHTDDVAELCKLTARQLGLSDEQGTAIERGAVLHDVGKAAIPDAILNKPGPLNDEEWAFMRRHTIIGERILMGAPALADVAKLVRSSHESFDGSGYPDALAGEAIPLGARIIAVCDAFDAMITDRPYRAALTRTAALAELRRCAGTQFDPAVVEAFARAVGGPGAGASRPGGPGCASLASRATCSPPRDSA